MLAAQTEAEAQVEFILKKTRFFDRYRDQLNDRQTKVVKRMLEEGPKGFAGGMNARKFMSLVGVSKATATRDLHHLAQIGALIPVGSGRSSRYEVNLVP